MNSSAMPSYRRPSGGPCHHRGRGRRAGRNDTPKVDAFALFFVFLGVVTIAAAIVRPSRQSIPA
jgi:hypothetical protein